MTRMKIKKSEIKVNNDGYGIYYTYNGLRLFGSKNPTIVLTAQNEYDRRLRAILPLIDGAKCLYSKNKP